jgi:hypothetical protein
VRVERLQSIDHEGVLASGVRYSGSSSVGQLWEGTETMKNRLRWQFERQWDLGHKRGPSWASNPFVFVIGLERA